ncbi:hypothetical protein Pan241w_30510 [Gimesia alba]|uniref:Uncharacterized protein n=1 Tax=Gimesia alba TaxID=2527973 RepID=A0A517RGE9_9PLAN|nr:hypothetical protein [Gimesia alba]QDT42956.1 hypothetical protein Pan241w_30510 [Gimesia alba]
MFRNIFYLAWLCLMLIPGVVSAQKLPMTVDIYQPTQFPKGDGPIDFVWQCSVSATGLLEGYFLVTVHDGSEQFGQYKSHEVALHSGFHEVPMMLPPIKVDNPFSEVKLKLSFVTSEQRHDFKDEFTLRVGRTFLRTFALGICDPFDSNLLPKTKDFLEKLKFESISPESPITVKLDPTVIQANSQLLNIINNRPMSLNCKTVSIQITPDEFPQLPIECHQYDLMLITPRGFELLESRHFKAIYQWVRSGGSLCLITGATPGTTQLQFLNQLAGDDTRSPFLLSPEGKLDVDPANQIWFQRTGWGRSVIVQSETLEKELLSEQELIQIPFFLWKLRESQRNYYEKEKTWDYQEMVKVFVKSQETVNHRYRNPYIASEIFNLNYRPIFTGGAVVTDLMPSEMRIVPSWLIASILFGYVLLVGPGEYFILGKFKLRRFTWITFPAISICFAFLVFMISDYFMQTSHERKNLAIIDLDAQGKPVKENQIELLFTGSYQTIETNVKSGLFATLNHSELGMIQNYNVYNRNTTPALVEPPFYSGSIPTQYSVYLRMPQWTPQLNRIISNYPAELQTEFNWSSIQVAELKSEPGRQKIQKQVYQAFGNQAQLLIYQGVRNGKVKNYRYLSSVPHTQTRYSKAYALVNPIAPPYQGRSVNQERQRSFMDDLCVRNQGGLFQIISQTSPSGGRNYEDLSILDPSDPRQWLVVIYVPGDEQDTIYRQLIISKT